MENYLEPVHKLEVEIKDLQARKKEVIAILQDECGHDPLYVVEGDYQPEGIITYAQPEFRVCRRCGYAEEGWARYKNLSYDVPIPRMSREAAWKYVRTFIRREDR